MPPADDELVVHGIGLHRLTAPDTPIGCGNAGTLIRLLAGILAKQRGRFELTNDESLRRSVAFTRHPRAAAFYLVQTTLAQANDVIGMRRVGVVGEAGDGVELIIRAKQAGVLNPQYKITLADRDLQSSQFPWTFQKLLYDCLTDYIVELFTKCPMTG